MKRIMPMSVAVLVFAAAVAHAGEAPTTVVPGSPGEPKLNTIDVAMELAAVFPTLPDAPRFTAKGAGAIAYRIKGTQAQIVAESIPEMTFESDAPMGGEEKIAVVVEAIPGTTPAVDWSSYPRVALKPVDLRVRAYRGAAAAAGREAQPLLDIVLEDLALSTERIEVEGIVSGGYLDPDGPEAQLAGRAILPDDPFPPYAEWLAGEPVILELRVAIANPYKR